MKINYPSEEVFAEHVAEKALDNYMINGKCLREWINILSGDLTLLETVKREVEQLQIAEGRYEGFYDCRRKVMQIIDSIYQGNDEEKKKSINVTPFKYVWASSPVDNWDNGILCSREEKLRVILDMPETPQDGEVYKTYLPGDRGVLEAVYMCKADNNGTTYMFADEEVACLSKDNVIRS